MRLSLKRSGEAEDVDGAAGGNGDVFSSVDGEGHWRCIDRTAHLEVPQRLERLGVEGDEVSFGIAAEDQASGCGEHS